MRNKNNFPHKNNNSAGSNRMITKEQRKVIRLLQNKEVLITNDIEKKFFVTQGNEVKKIRIDTLYNLVNAGLVFRQQQAPFHYILSTEGEMIKV